METALLVALAIALPLSEFWKNLLLLVYPIVWLANRARGGDFGGPWRLWDSLIAFWVASAYAAAWFSGFRNNEWGDTTELALAALVLWLVMRGGYAARELTWVAGALVVSTVAGLAFGHYQLYVSHRRSSLQLHSVGHVNHTAIYLAIMLGACASWLFARWRAWSGTRRAAALAVGVLVAVSLVETASRGAIGIAAFCMLALAVLWWPRWRTPLVGSLAALALAGAAAVALDAEFIRKQQAKAATDDVLNARDSIWRTGIAAWERFPWFGVGKDNYGMISREHIRQWRAAAGQEFDPSRYVPYNHAHNLFVNTLAERGGVGLGALAALLLAWVAWLVSKRPRPGDADLDWQLWGSAASAWGATVGIGMVNTTFHHEHGMLALLLLGLWLCRLRAEGARA